MLDCLLMAILSGGSARTAGQGCCERLEEIKRCAIILPDMLIALAAVLACARAYLAGPVSSSGAPSYHLPETCFNFALLCVAIFTNNSRKIKSLCSASRVAARYNVLIYDCRHLCDGPDRLQRRLLLARPFETAPVAVTQSNAV